VNLITNIRIRAGKLALARELARYHRLKKNSSLSTAKSIGLLYYLADEATYNTVEAFVQSLIEKKKKVRLICYTDAKIVPHYFIPKLTQDIVTRKDLNWFRKPAKGFVKEFIGEKFDLLLDLSLLDSFPLQYIAALSKASLKVGRFDEEHTEYYDLMIDTSGVTGPDEFITQIDHYLNMLNQEPDGQQI
jgi:hypothetical protein